MSISPRDRLVITIVAAVLVLVALIAALVYPQFQQVRKLNTQVIEAEAQADAAKLQLEQRQGFKDRAIETNAKWLGLMNEVPETPDLPSLIIELQDSAYESGVQVISVTPTQPTQLTGYAAVPISIEVLGTWADTVDYLQSLMKLDRGVRVVGTNVTVAGSGALPERRNSKVPAYAVSSVISIETYLIPAAVETATPSATSTAQ
ncbi:MAG: type 4a pilus biogenesis protein PilO [Coriobacteriia bacterium]|nr:type 4a pilus biogenesis protein PilO [Coriobacteriia bacterium]